MILRKGKKKGFTLIELMIVVAIIGILAAVAIPKFADLVTKSKEASIKGQLGAVRSAVSIYYGDTEGEYPSNLTLGLTTNSRYLPSTGGSQAIGTMNIPRTTTGNGGHAYGQVVNSQVEQGDGTAPGFNTAVYYISTGNNAGHLFVNCSHNDTKSNLWSSY